MNLQSTITCPTCGTVKLETMPTEACQFFYDCTGCGTLLRPKPGDCCVFCSYGDVACPPVRANGVLDYCTVVAAKAGSDACVVRPGYDINR